MKLSKEFENLVSKQLESFGCSLGVEHLIVYLASAKEGSKAGFKLFSQWPEIDKLLMPIDDDPELKVSSPRRRWYPLQEKDILIGVLRVETTFTDGEWPLLLDSRIKALTSSLAKTFSIEIERQRNEDEISFLRNQLGVIIHQLRNPLAAIRTYAKLLVKRLGSDKDSIKIVESMMLEQNQINNYVNSFEKINKPLKIPFGIGEERLLLLPNLDSSSNISIREILAPILARGKANAKLQNRCWTEPSNWPDWTTIEISHEYRVIAEIVANLLENAFKYSEKNADIGIFLNKSGLCIFDNGKKIPIEESERIFQKAFRGSASKEKEGSGVGLYLARKLAKQIKGDLILLDNHKDLNINKDIKTKNIKCTNLFLLKIPIKLLRK
ncbi:MAG: two-component sensor histidine kinase [Prochlorococcus sp. SP3034]|nr:two-component sensor histidine kinase [Prochlorococcus sp. SP3034]|tara:strand:+ start:6772 stop:7917 length:1146 start_codon:yes stop_codon:yes gene_type:complete